MTAWLLAPGSPRRLGALRLLVGTYAVGWLVVLAPELLGLADLDPARYEPLGVLGPLGSSPPAAATVTGLWGATVATGVGFAAGWRHRVVAPMFAVGLLVLTTYQNSWGKVLHTENLLVVHVLVLAVSPAAGAYAVGRGRAVDLDARRTGWPVRVLALATVAAYAVAGTTKLRTAGWEWIDPENLRNWVAYDLVRKELFGDPYLPIAVPLLEHAWAFLPAVLVTLAVELGAPLALLGRRIALAWVLAAWSLHVAVLAVMSVAFPYHLSGLALAPVLLCQDHGPWRPRSRSSMVEATHETEAPC